MPAEQLVAGESVTPHGKRLEPRVLVLAEALPWPTLKGGDLRTWQNVNALAGCATVGVFGLCSNDARRAAPAGVPLALWASSTDPALAYPPPKGVRLAGRAWLLDPHGHPADLYYSDAAARELRAIVETFRPDVVIIEGLWLYRYIEVVQSAGCLCVLDCHNVEAALLRELARATRGADLQARVVRDVIPARTAVIERHAVHAVDQLWVCSREDERRLSELYAPATPVHVVPNAVRLGDHDAGARGAAPLTLLFMGFYPHVPNTIAAEFLIDAVFPELVAARAEARLLLVGARPPASLRAAAARDPRIVVTGALPDIGPELARATVLVVPLFQGGGTRLKVLEAFAAGLPVVSTAKGVEGLDVVDGTHVLLAESATDFVAASLALWRDPALAARLAANARELVAERYSWQAAGTCVREAISALTATR